MKKTILLGLNELNFEYIKFYIDKGHLKNFQQVFKDHGYSETVSETKYELLEPWIQWVTVMTGKTFDEHQVFRLGDITEREDLKQVFEKIEDNGYSIGAVSPFNTANRLKKSEFFAPDPWTQTPASGNKTFVNLSNAVSQAVNDNAHGKLTKKSIKALIKGLAKYTSISDYTFYAKNILKLKSQTGVKALILDKLLADAFMLEWKKTKPDFSNLFLNTGAHFQHHYMFNSAAYVGDLKNPQWYCPKEQDPLLEILRLYDQILGSLMKLPVRLVIATGLHQKPHKHLTYYWRIKEHKAFLDIIGINNYKEVIPRMSRDFLIDFNSKDDAYVAEEILASFKSNINEAEIFTIDNRGESLFVELTYPGEIGENFSIHGNKRIDDFKKYIAFVAIKNGEHDGIGYVVDTENRIPKHPFQLSQLHNYLMEDYELLKQI